MIRAIRRRARETGRPFVASREGLLPLASLRTHLDERAPGAHWTMHPDGVLGRALMMPAPGTVSVPLRLSGPVGFVARLMLLPHDWRDGQGEVGAAVTVTDPNGVHHELWAGRLRPARRRGRPRGHQVSLPLPEWTNTLSLSLHPGAPQYRAVARAIWLEPMLTDPSAPSVRRPSVGSPAGRPPAATAAGPLFSVLAPVHDPPPHMLDEAVASVILQTFTDWELWLVDDGSRDPEVIAALQHHEASDPRIHLVRRSQAGGISSATNAALDRATGSFVALLDHDDTLAPDALQLVADQIAMDPDVDMIYSDEAIMADGRMLERHIKPGWSPEHMAVAMYTCHFGIYRRAVAVDIGGFQTQFDGTQDYDFVLRLMEHTDRVAHIPRVLYHWRAHAGSTAGGEQSKPFAYLLQPGAIRDHHQRNRVDAKIQFAQFPGMHRVVHRVESAVEVDLVLAVKDERGVTQAAATWLAQPHRNWKVVVGAPGPTLSRVVRALEAAGIPNSRITAVPTGAGEPAAALAAVADAATSHHLLLMQSPVMGLTHDWLIRLLGYCSQSDIAAAGPVVLARDGRIQEAGVAMPEGIALPLRYGLPAAAAPPVVYNLTAVTGVMATSRRAYQQLGPVNPQLGQLSFIDYCLRAPDAGMRVVLIPDARVRATSNTTTENDLPNLWRLRQTWARNHTHDPYYSISYRADRGDFIPTASV